MNFIECLKLAASLSEPLVCRCMLLAVLVFVGCTPNQCKLAWQCHYRQAGRLDVQTAAQHSTYADLLHRIWTGVIKRRWRQVCRLAGVVVGKFWPVSFMPMQVGVCKRYCLLILKACRGSGPVPACCPADFLGEGRRSKRVSAFTPATALH